MIQPEAYYAAHKEAPDPLTLGRIGFALVGREEELDPPLTTAERFLLGTILRCNKWHNEKRDEVQEKWRKQKKAQKERALQSSTGISENPAEGGGKPSSTTSTDLPTYLPTSLPKRIHSEPIPMSCGTSRRRRARIGLSRSMSTR